MLWRFTLTGIKSRLRDSLVLFSGLVMASAIFYMFESMASNKAFEKQYSSCCYSYHFPTRFCFTRDHHIRLYFIREFLFDDNVLRQKDYAMFMMLGAKGRKIAQMIFSENISPVGIAAA